MRLLGVQLDDEVLFNGIIDIVSLGKGNNLAAQEVLILFQPLGSDHRSVLTLCDCLESCCGAACFAYGDNVAYLYEVGRNVDLFAVHGKVSVVNQLSCFSSGGSQAETEHNVVESALYQ